MVAPDYSHVFEKQTLADAFPDVPPPTRPYGGRVLVQLRRLPTKTRGGIQLLDDANDTAKWNNQIAKLVLIGPIAFRNRETGEEWPEGMRTWAKVGDFVRVPRWDGDRHKVEIRNQAPVTFAVLNDYQLIGEVLGDPLEQSVYEL